MAEQQEVLVRGPNWVGDLVMSTPGFRALRTGLRDARLTLLVRPELAPLVAGAPWFDEVVPLHSYHRGARALLREARALRRKRRYDVGLCIPDSASSALLMRLAGVRRVVGYARDGREWILHEAIAPDPAWGRRRLVARERSVLGLVESLGCRARGTELELHTTDDEEARASRVLDEAGATGAAPLALLAPGASYGPAKCWPVDSFARVGDALLGSGACVLVVGAPGEVDRCAEVVGAMRGPAIDLSGRADLAVLKAIVRRASVLVCNDAGARHVAVAFGVPTVALFGPTSLAKTDLNLEHVRAIEGDAHCRPCYLRECPIDHRCMVGIEPERVAEAALVAFAEGSARQRSAALPTSDAVA